MSDETVYYSVSEVAKRLGLHPETIRRNVKSGKIEALIVPLTGEYRFTDEAVCAYEEKLRPVPINHTETA